MCATSYGTKPKELQAPLLKLLRDRKVEYRSFYIVNMIWVKGDFNLAWLWLHGQTFRESRETR